MSKTPVVDPWLLDAAGNPDPFSNNIDWGANLQDLRDPDLPPEETPPPTLDPEVIRTSPVEPVVEPPPPPPEPEGPEVFELTNGEGTVTLEKEKGWWVATLESPESGKPQRYKGKNKSDLLLEVLKAQANATRKIRDLNRQVKLGNTTQPQPVVPPPTPTVKQLTAEEIFEIKTLYDSNPAAALDASFLKTYGITPKQLIEMAQRGDRAALDLEAESINRQFTVRNPDYYGDEEYKNFASLVQWVAKYKAGKTIPKGQEDNVFYSLVSSGIWNVENIEEAFADLSSSDLLIKPVKVRTPPPPPVPEPEPAPRPDPRIVRTETRPRAGLGIRPTDVTPVVTPDTPKPPSAEDLESLSDDEISALLRGVRKQRVQSRRSN